MLSKNPKNGEDGVEEFSVHKCTSKE